MADSVGGRRGSPSDSVLGLVVAGGCLVWFMVWFRFWVRVLVRFGSGFWSGFSGQVSGQVLGRFRSGFWWLVWLVSCGLVSCGLVSCGLVSGASTVFDSFDLLFLLFC